MMQRIIFISLCVFSSSVTTAQDLDTLIFREYRYFSDTVPADRQLHLIRKAQLYVHASGKFDEALREYKRVRWQLLKDTLTLKHELWNAAICAYSVGDEAYAAQFFSKYQQLFSDLSTEELLIGALIQKNYDSVAFREKINMLVARDSIFRGLHCLETIRDFDRRGPGIYILSSALVPGSGTILNGYPLKGITSLLLCGASAFGVYSLVSSRLMINAVGWGSGVGIKFYGGNLRLTERSWTRRTAEKKSRISQNCESALSGILDRYPINIRH